MYNLLIIIAVLLGIYYFLIRPQLYWWYRGVAQKFPIPIFGNALDMFLTKKDILQTQIDQYETIGENNRYFGIYTMTTPSLVIKDLDLITKITIKDFDHFVNHMNFSDPEIDPYWGSNLFSLKDEKWRMMRATLSPAFTASKMRSMFSLINDCAKQFTNHYLQKNENELSVECKDIFTRYTTDVIGTCAFGITVDSLKNPDNDFNKMGKDLTNLNKLSVTLLFLLSGVSTKLSKLFGLKLISKPVSDFFESLISETIRIREANNVVRPDMIHLLLEARKGKLNHEDEIDNKDSIGFATAEESHIGKQLHTDYSKKPMDISIMDITAQALIFFFGGFDTSSNLMCFMAHELVENPDVQEKLRQEVDEMWQQCQENLTYDILAKMKYMDMVMSETLRKWPPGIASDRVCVKPYTIEPEHSHEVPVQINVGDTIFIPTYGIHRDPKYYPNPEHFDPERFNEDNRKSQQFQKTYMPFGTGPRNCIGSRFALMETKTVFYHLLSKFELTIVDKTQIPLQFSKTALAIYPEKGFWIGLKLRA